MLRIIQDRVPSERWHQLKMLFTLHVDFNLGSRSHCAGRAEHILKCRVRKSSGPTNQSQSFSSIVMDSVKLSREYLAYLNWIKLASNHCELDSSTVRAADRYPQGESSNPARIHFFSWLRQCRLIVKFSYYNTMSMILKQSFTLR